jgi:hypothetical protein
MILLSTAIYWLYKAEFIVERILDVIINAFFMDPPSTIPSGTAFHPIAELFNFLSYSPLLFFILIAVLFGTTIRFTDRLSIVVVTTFILIPLMFPGPTLLLDSLSSVNIGRFTHYTFIFTSITGATGLHLVISRLGWKRSLLIILSFSSMGFLTISNDYVASDNPIVERPFYTYYLTESERDSFEHISSTSKSQIVADRISCLYL